MPSKNPKPAKPKGGKVVRVKAFGAWERASSREPKPHRIFYDVEGFRLWKLRYKKAAMREIVIEYTSNQRGAK